MTRERLTNRRRSQAARNAATTHLEKVERIVHHHVNGFADWCSGREVLFKSRTWAVVTAHLRSKRGYGRLYASTPARFGIVSYLSDHFRGFEAPSMPPNERTVGIVNRLNAKQVKLFRLLSASNLTPNLQR